MDRKRTQLAAIVSMVVLALVCSVAAQQQQQPQPIAVDPPKPADCKTTNTKPSPTQESYVVGKCIVAKFGAYLAFNAPNKTTNFVEFSGVSVSNASKCESNETNPKLVVDFSCGQLEFEFQKDSDNTTISVKSINGKYQLDGKNTTFGNATAMFKIDKGHYYKCNTEQTIVFSNTTKLVLSNVALEAFRGDTSGTDFYKMPEECALDSAGASDFVRIGVGISLALLAALVLVAYFVGRRRWAERSSYESV